MAWVWIFALLVVLLGMMYCGPIRISTGGSMRSHDIIVLTKEDIDDLGVVKINNYKVKNGTIALGIDANWNLRTHEFAKPPWSAYYTTDGKSVQITVLLKINGVWGKVNAIHGMASGQMELTISQDQSGFILEGVRLILSNESLRNEIKRVVIRDKYFK